MISTGKSPRLNTTINSLAFMLPLAVPKNDLGKLPGPVISSAKKLFMPFRQINAKGSEVKQGLYAESA